MRIRFHKPITLTPKDKTPKSKTITKASELGQETKSTPIIPPETKTSTQSECAVEFYEDMAAVVEKYHGLQNELKGVSSAWVSWASGTYYNMIPDELKVKINQMIIVNPDSELLKELAKGDNSSHSELIVEINKATRMAKSKNTQVRYSDKPIMYCIIGDPNADNAWARLLIYLPYTNSQQWSNIVIHKMKNRTLFNRVRDAYVEMFKNSIQA